MSGSKKNNNETQSEQLITMTTSALKDRLNSVYSGDRKRSQRLNSFENLWDLKEMALLEGKSSIEVPRTWIDELDTALTNNSAVAKN